MKTPDISYDQLGNDMYATFRCVGADCADDQYDWQKDFKYPRTIKFSGYDDANFYDNVYKDERECVCKCGQKYMYRWTRNGMELEVIQKTEE